MPTLAALNRKARKLQGVTAALAKAHARQTAAAALADALKVDARLCALRSYLDADANARRWVAWLDGARQSKAADALATLDAAGSLSTVPVAQEERDALTLRLRTAHARYLLDRAYGADEARRAVLAEFAQRVADTYTTADEPTEAKRIAAERRAALRAATQGCLETPYPNEPECPAVIRGAVAMLLLLSDPALLAALPGTPRVGLMLPDALRQANMLLPEKSQATIADADKK